MKLFRMHITLTLLLPLLFASAPRHGNAQAPTPQ